MDLISWKIILEDFQNIYQQIIFKKMEIITLPLKTISIKNWITKLMIYSQFSEIYQQKMKYWNSIFKSSIITTTINVPLDDINEKINNTVEFCNEITVEFSKQTTDILYQRISKIYQIQISEIILTALLISFIKWGGEDSLLIYFKNYGSRENIFGDISRTVGQFTSTFPLYLKSKNSIDIKQELKYVKEQIKQISFFTVVLFQMKKNNILSQFKLLEKKQFVFDIL